MSYVEKLLANKERYQKMVGVTVRMPTDNLNTIDQFADSMSVSRQDLLLAMVQDGIEALQELSAAKT